MIDLLPNSDQQQIADSIQRFLADKLPVERLMERQAKNRIFEKDIWGELSELGAFGLSVAEAQGGVGLGMVEEIMTFREYGRVLASPTILGTVIAAHLAASAGNDALVGELVAGTRRAAILNALPGAKLGATTSGDFHLIDAEADDLWICWNEAGAALFEASAGKGRKTIGCIDATVKFERVTLSNAKPLIYQPAAKAAVWQAAQLLIAASLTGMLEAVRDLSVEYAKTREQFGHPIGVYQGVKHRCSDMALWAEAAWSQTAWAALTLQSGGEDTAFQVANAKMVAAEAALDSARRGIQIYGGMGFTAEVTVHLFLKRTHLYGQLGGDVARLPEKLLELPLHV
jgi:alkylation response protein AidB-like acyl-CoA dehydrogenase